MAFIVLTGQTKDVVRALSSEAVGAVHAIGEALKPKPWIPDPAVVRAYEERQAKRARRAAGLQEVGSSESEK